MLVPCQRSPHSREGRHGGGALAQAPLESLVSAPTPPVGGWKAWVPHVLGVAVLGGLLACVSVDAVVTSLPGLGARVAWVFVLALAWMAVDAQVVSILVGGRVPWGRLLYQQVVSDAIGQAVPLMGLAGEPWRARELASTLTVDDACGAVVRLRMVHAASGLLHAAWTLALALTLVPLPAPWPQTLGVLAGGAAVMGLSVVAAALSAVPTRLAAAVLRVLRLPGTGSPVAPHRGRILAALACKMFARALQMLEIAAVLALLGVAPGPVQVVTVAASIAFGATLFFMMPQGLGVNEAAITIAVVLLGLPASLGLTLALVRRARIVCWTLVGLGVGWLGSLASLSHCWKSACGAGDPLHPSPSPTPGKS